MQCPVCHGSGISPGTFGTDFAIECGACHGSGWRPDPARRAPERPRFDASGPDENDERPDERDRPAEGPTTRAPGGIFGSLVTPNAFSGGDFLQRPGLSRDPGPSTAPDAEAATPQPTVRSDPPPWTSSLTGGLFSASASYERFASLFASNSDPPAAPAGPDDWDGLSDIEVLMKLLEVDRRYLSELPNTGVGRATPATATALTAIIADYRRFADLPRALPTVGADDLRRKLAEATGALARVHESLDDLDAAERRYAEAREIHAALGHAREVDGCDRSLRELRRHRDGDVDAALDDLRTRLAATVEPLARAELTVELAELHGSVNDDFEALDLFEEAESLLEPYRRETGGGATADALASTLAAIMEGRQMAGETAVERSLRIRGLLRRVYQGLGQILRDEDPDRAADYLARIDDMEGSIAEGSRDNAEFTARMSDALKGLFGDDPDA